MANSLRIYSWNVNGLRSVIKKNLFEFLKKEKPDLLCLQETKMVSEQFKELPEISDYVILESSATHKKGYSGVAILIKKSLEKDFKLEAKEIGIKHFDQEGRFLILKHKNFKLYNIYFPSGTSGEERQDFKYKFLDGLLKHLNSLNNKEHLIICGDFNICHKEIDIHHPDIATKKMLTGFLPEERAWMDKFIASGFVDCYRKINGEKKNQYTWWSLRANSRAKNLGWRIDYFFTSKKLSEKVKSAEILQKIPGSDHCPVSIEIKI